MASFEFVWWPIFLLLPLPLAVYFLLPPANSSAPVYLPYLPESDSAPVKGNRMMKLLVLLVWLTLITAAARPVWYGEPIVHQPEHRDLMLVVDLSGSMAREDMQHNGQYIDRLSAVKQVLENFIEQRQGDRLGLVFFADHAYLQTPLTLDRDTINNQLQQIVLDLIGQSTAIGEGIGLATKTFVDSDAPQRVMILLSDGSNTSGVLDPIEAANIAKKYNTTIYTVGVGAGEMEVKKFFFSQKVNTARDLDEATLTEIANITGGKYFRARNAQDLADIYATINQLEPISQATQTWRPQQEWFRYPLAIALIFSCIVIWMRRNHV